MKLTSVLLIMICLHVSAKVHSQERVTLSEKNAPLKTILQEIRKQTGYAYVFNDQWELQIKKINIEVKNASVEEVLDWCFRDQIFSYMIVNKTIVVRKREEKTKVIGELSPQAFIDIHGQVLDEKNRPAAGVTVNVKGSKNITTTNENGEFTLKAVDKNAVLVFSSVNMEPFEIKVDGKMDLVVNLKTKIATLGNVDVVYSSGYQNIPKERATGSFDFINTDLFNRRVATDVLSHIDGIASGVIFNKGSQGSNEKLGISIRGVSTISGYVNADPLIIVDNFPYDGDINNINPNDVENITILKDAASASIWGARSGNGVIVINTKRGHYNQAMKIDFGSNVTIINKPNLYYSRNYLPSKDYIGVEKYLFNQGYYDDALTDTYNWAVVSPAVEILSKQRLGVISQADANTQINNLEKQDVRKDFLKYVYRKGINQQYAFNINGGSNNINYTLSAGFDKNSDNLIRNGYNRLTFKSFTTYAPIKNLEISMGITYTQSKVQNNNTNSFGNIIPGGNYSALYPYAQLADQSGNALAIVKNYRSSFIDSVEKLGFLDWNYRPLDEIKNANNTSKLNDIVLNARIRYKFNDLLNIEVQYQNEKQINNTYNYYSQATYYTRNYINLFTQYDPTTQTLIYPFPMGAILSLGNSELDSKNIRGQLNYFQALTPRNSLSAIAGAEIKKATTNGYERDAYGYDDIYGTSIYNLDFVNYFPINPSGSLQIPTLNGNIFGSDNRSISYYINAAYTHNNRYTLSLSGRKDGSNIFGVKTNDRVTPLWSTGISWNISKERFYHINWLRNLKLRTTFGYNGNVYNGAAYLIASYSGNSIAGTPTNSIVSPPNSNLRWERVRNINVGIDFESNQNVISGAIELYQKNGRDLIESLVLPPSSGFPSYFANSANNQTKGIDFTLNSRNIDRVFKWYSTVLLNYITDKVTKFDYTFTTENDATTYLLSASQGGSSAPYPGRPLYGLYSYRSAGLDPSNGDPQGYLNGKPTKNYDSLINASTPKDLVFNGTVRPKLFGSFRNTISFKKITLSANVIYKFGYYFRKQSTSLNYQDIIASPNSDYAKRWQKSGDEKITYVPSVTYPSDYERNQFYQFSNSLIDKADHIRLQDIQISYDFDKNSYKKFPFSHLQMYVYVNNIGILWKKNKDGIDPDYPYSYYPNTRTFSLGIKANL